MTHEIGRPLLRVRGMLKMFPGLVALDRVSLDVHPGEIVSVVGQNGSGKSTLVKILAGVYAADGGRVELAEGTGLHFIHQDLALVPELSAAENLALMRGTGAGGLAPFHDRRRSERARELVARFGPVFDVDVPVRRLTPAQRAVVAISRALDGWTHSANVLLLDEPTESLHRSEVDVLFEAVRRLAAHSEQEIIVALADQRNLAGLGNVYVNELCFLRGLAPGRPVAEVDLAQAVALAERLIRANRERVARTTTGDTRPGRRLWVHGRGGQPCRRCGTTIRHARHGRTELELRETWWCPHCQT